MRLGLGLELTGNGQGGVAPVTLATLTLSASTIPENSPVDTVVGSVVGATSGSTLSLTDTASGRFKQVAGVIKADTAGTDYEAGTSHNITLRETLAGATNTPNDTIIAITVTDVLDRNALMPLGTFLTMTSPAKQYLLPSGVYLTEA